MSKVLIVSTHADDEAYGMGGTIFRLKEEGHQIYWLIMTRVWSPRWSDDKIFVRESDIEKAIKFYDFNKVIRWDYKDNLLDTYSKDEIQNDFIDLLNDIEPEIIYTPGYWENNFEHKLTYELIEISTKPIYSSYIKKIIAYEIPSSTELSLNFNNIYKPNCYNDIKKYLHKKIEACRIYGSEIKSFPHARSAEYVEVLSKFRGVECGLEFAESFYVVKEINS